MTQPTQSDSLKEVPHDDLWDILKELQLSSLGTGEYKIEDLEDAWRDVSALYAPKPDEDVEDILEKMYSEAYQCGVGAKHPDAYRPIKVVVSNTLAKLAAHYAAKEQEAYIAGVNADKRSVQEAVLRARIEEIEHIPYWGTPYGTDVFGYEKLFKDNRIFTLTNQLNQMKGEK